MKNTGTPESTSLRIAGFHARVVRIRVIVTDPRFEQVAEDIKGIGGRGLPIKETQELLADRRLALLEVQVRNEECRQGEQR